MYNGCQSKLIINEVLYDPPNDLPGDANGDGTCEIKRTSLSILQLW